MKKKNLTFLVQNTPYSFYTMQWGIQKGVPILQWRYCHEICGCGYEPNQGEVDEP